MARRRRSGANALQSQRDDVALQIIYDILQKQPVDVVRLRKHVAVRGVPAAGLRSAVWPLVLGLSPSGTALQGYAPNKELDGEMEEAEAVTRDAHVIQCDIDRSLWAFTEGWTEARRQQKREELRDILLQVLRLNPGTWYYQGLHDVAAVFLFTVGQGLAIKLLSHLVRCHLRDATRPGLTAITQTLGILYPLLQACDPGLYDFLVSLEEPALDVPFFALSWLLTWFAHDVPDLESISRLFDLFLSSHPLMPLYLAAVAIKNSRNEILACGTDGPAVYGALKTMRVLRGGRSQADSLACEAAALYKKVPPSSLVHLDLFQAVAMDAFLVDGVWQVPPLPLRQEEHGVRASVKALGLVYPERKEGIHAVPARRARSAGRIMLLSAAAALVAAGAALILSQP